MSKISGISGNNGPVDSRKKINKDKSFKNVLDEKTKAEKKPEAKKSGKAELPVEARKAINETPDVRAERIAELKEKIAKGNYKVDARTLADAMLKKGFKP